MNNTRKTIRNSQKKFYSNLTKEIINELIYIFDSTSGSSPIQGRINEERRKRKRELNVKINTDITENGLFINYVRYLPNKNKETFHFSIHFNIHSFNIQNQGPIHVKALNENKTTYTTAILISSFDPLTFSIDDEETDAKVSNYWKEESEIIFQILESYFLNKTNNKHYLLRYKHSKQINHPLLNTLLKTMNNSSIKSGIYRKNHPIQQQIT